MKVQLVLKIDSQPKVASSEVTIHPKELKETVQLLTDQLKDVVNEEF